MTTLETERLILRPWDIADAEECYKYAKDPRVGPAAGWAVHTSVEDSRRVIRDVLTAPETYAIVLKETGLPIGSIGFHHNDLAQKDDEAELGYWLGVPYWGRGLVPEAAREMLRHAFCDLGLARVWCAYYDGNEKSRRVQEKLGFIPQWTSENVEVPQLGEVRKGHVNLLTREDWEKGASAYDGISIRYARVSDAESLIAAESVCFPPNEAEKAENVKARLLREPSLFLTAWDGDALAGFICGVPTREERFRDEFFTDPGLYEPDGKNVVMLSLEVLPEYRGRGLGRRLMNGFAQRAVACGRDRLILTCHTELIPYYESMGFVYNGRANSSWGGAEWQEMVRLLKKTTSS